MRIRIRRWTLFVFILGLIFSFPALAEHRIGARLITVSGEAEVKVIPDEVILTMSVETWNQDLGSAKNQNDDRVKNVLSLAKEFKLEPKHVQTDRISIEPRYKDTYEKKLLGYFVRKTIVFTLKDISRFEELLSQAVKSGANYVHGIQFRTTELRKYRNQARALAIKAAREKAIALAAELSQKVGKPYSIREDQTGWSSLYNRWGGGLAQNVQQNAGGEPLESESGIAPGQISVSARVTVSFELE